MQADEFQSELLLREYLQEAEQRYARERRAYQAVLGLLRHSRPLLAVSIEEISMSQQIFMVHSSTADRSTLVRR